MKKVILGLITALLFLGCDSKGIEQVNVEPKLVVGKSLESLKLNDQFENAQTLKAETTKVIFAFSKDMAHICNDYFATKEEAYLSKNTTQFVADVSSAPSLIRSMFILPGLKDFKHTVLLLDEESVALPYKAGVDSEKMIVVYVQNKAITDIKTITTEEELIQIIEAK